MANRNLKRVLTYLVGDTDIDFKFAVGATGAVGTITPAAGNAIKSVTRNSAGNYTIVLKDNFKGFNRILPAIEFASGGAVMNPALQVKTWSYNAAAAGGATIVLQVVTLASPEVAADAPNGSEIHVSIKASNTSLVNQA